jgi:hypothetical protein
MTIGNRICPARGTAASSPRMPSSASPAKVMGSLFLVPIVLQFIHSNPYHIHLN